MYSNYYKLQEESIVQYLSLEIVSHFQKNGLSTGMAFFIVNASLSKTQEKTLLFWFHLIQRKTRIIKKDQ